MKRSGADRGMERRKCSAIWAPSRAPSAVLPVAVRQDPRPPTDEEVAAAVAAAPEPMFADLFTVAASTGLAKCDQRCTALTGEHSLWQSKYPTH